MEERHAPPTLTTGLTMPPVPVKTIQLLLMLIIVAFSGECLAIMRCPNELAKTDNLYDLTTLPASQISYFVQDDETGKNAKYDLRCRISRHQLAEGDPMYALNAIGIVTKAVKKEGEPGFIDSVKQQENTEIGTGFMISPCHMITNKHVVCEGTNVNGRKVCNKVQNKQQFVNFSCGEHSAQNNPLDRVTGEVVRTTSNPALDYAIVRIDSLKKKEKVPFLIPDFEPGKRQYKDFIAVVPGYAIEFYKKDSFKIAGMKAQMNYSNTGNYILGHYTSTPGQSGSPAAFRIGNNLYAAGLNVDSFIDGNGNPLLNGNTNPNATTVLDKKEKNHMPSLKAIGEDLYGFDPGLLNEINQAVNTGRCQ